MKTRKQTIVQFSRLRFEELDRRNLLTITPIGEPVLVNSSFNGMQLPNDAEFNAAGDLLVSFSGAGTSGDGVYARRFSSSNQPLGSEFFVAAGAESRVAWGPAGELFVTWEGTGANGVGVYGRVFDAAEVPRLSPG